MPESTTTSPKRKLLVPILVFIIILLLGVIIFTAVYSYLMVRRRAANPPDQNRFTISVNNPAIESAMAVYNFKISVKEVKEVTEGLIITPNDSNDNLPRFLITPKTSILTESLGKQTYENVKNLKPGQNIRIIASVDVSTRKWSINDVIILP
jgi:hypothetical protein